MRCLTIALGLVLALAVGGCVVQPISMQAASQSPAAAGGAPVVEGSASSDIAGAYVLKSFDPISVRFSGIKEQVQLDLVIDENGYINLLHIKEPIKAAGLTPSQLEDKIETLYVEGQIYKNVSVNVTMTAKVYYVQGEVNAPGQFQLTSNTTLLQAIAGARGYTPFANRSKVTVSRGGRVFTYNAKALEKDPSKDIKIEAGDVIKVWQSIF